MIDTLWKHNSVIIGTDWIWMRCLGCLHSVFNKKINLVYFLSLVKFDGCLLYTSDAADEL